MFSALIFKWSVILSKIKLFNEIQYKNICGFFCKIIMYIFLYLKKTLRTSIYQKICPYNYISMYIHMYFNFSIICIENLLFIQLLINNKIKLIFINYFNNINM